MVSKSKISKEQRRRILERDNHRCVACWTKYRLTIHHHYDFTGTITPKGNSQYSNCPYGDTRDCDLVTLCRHCHGKIGSCSMGNKGCPFYRMITEYLAQFNSK